MSWQYRPCEYCVYSMFIIIFKDNYAEKSLAVEILTEYLAAIFFSGIKVVKLSTDFRSAQVRLKSNTFNMNAIGVHFGGSLFAMTDPFYMLMVMGCLGKDYVVWDKFADIDFIKPGKGQVTADFTISDALIKEILAHTADGEK